MREEKEEKGRRGGERRGGKGKEGRGEELTGEGEESLTMKKSSWLHTKD